MTKSDSHFADVIVDITSDKLDRTFQYRIPDELLKDIVPGSCVKVPFGNGGRVINGYVLSISDLPAIEEHRIKAIADVVTDSSQVESALVELAAFISRNYGTTLAKALRVVFPVKQKVKKRTVTYLHLGGNEVLWQERLSFYEKKNQVARIRLLKELIDKRVIPRSIVTGKLGVSAPSISALKEQGVCIESESEDLSADVGAMQDSKKVVLSDDQDMAVKGIISDIDSKRNTTSLIMGVTGSGKTEVYLNVTEHVIKSGRQAIVLIPEIALTYQTLMRFYERFKSRVATINSRLSKGEKFEIFEKARQGEIDVVIGPRSALFTPFDNLGVIIIDEEHEGSYKSEQMPRYHAREVAIKRAKIQGAMVLMGSATPSVDSYYRALNGQYKLYELKKRATGAKMPEVYIADLRNELIEGNKSPLSRILLEKIKDRLSKKEQVMLFLNRRGYAGFVSCRKCGYVFRCPHCDVSLGGHIYKQGGSRDGKGRLVCHYCGYTREYKKECPECGSKYVGVMKAGTEAIEKYVSSAFPEAVTLRMDMDTTRTKDGHEKILSAFASHEADILIGTQMIVKGHDFPLVTLVGVLAADLSLHASDYRAGERTFQLLTQAVGRAGRGDYKGEAVIQTYCPDDPRIIAAARQDYRDFYEQEIAYRGLLEYPPVAHLLCVLFESDSENDCVAAAALAAKTIKEDDSFCVKGATAGDTSLEIIGPSAASIAYIKDVFRQVLYFKCSDYGILTRVKDVLENNIWNNTRVSFDFDPMSGY